MSCHRFSAIILAAGFSSRMGKFKPLLPVGSNTVIERTISCFKNSGIMTIVVVTGHCADEIGKVIRSSGVWIVRNREYEKGMFSSVKVGVGILNAEKTDAFFIIPADICLVRPLTIRMLAEAFKKNPGKIIHPCFESKWGHPPLIPSQLIPVILKSPADHGLNRILKKYDNLAVSVPVPDKNILLNMNSPRDYKEVLSRFQNSEFS